MPYRYDPEFEQMLNAMQAQKAQVPPVPVHDVATRRKHAQLLLPMLNAVPLSPGVETKSFTTSAADSHELEMVWYSPVPKSAARVPGPAVLHIHGGGMIAFDVRSFHSVINNTVAASGVPMLSVDYRIAPEHSHPTLLDDCYTGLIWLHNHADQLNVDPARIGVMGESAGGGLAAGVALMARDRGLTPPLAKQILVYPMLDDRSVVSNKNLLPYVTYSYDDNLTGWSAYLGKHITNRTVDGCRYAVPARETNLSRLPATYIDVGQLDIFMAEDMEYARRLAAANVDTEFHLYPGVPHAFDNMLSSAKVSRKAIQNRVDALQSI